MSLNQTASQEDPQFKTVKYFMPRAQCAAHARVTQTWERHEGNRFMVTFVWLLRLSFLTVWPL